MIYPSMVSVMYEYNLGLRFENIVLSYANCHALKFSPSESVSYQELNKKANQLARQLRELGAECGKVVCISGLKTVETFACLLACLKLGAPYCILDNTSPVARLNKIISTCQPSVLFAEKALLLALSDICSKQNVTTFDNDPAKVDNAVTFFDDSNLQSTRKIPGNTLAYTMFTSGSTGVPKGAAMTHDNVLNLISWSTSQFKFKPSDILANVNPLYFDNSVFDIYSALFSGACLAPVSKEVVADPAALLNQIDDVGCTSWFSVPSLLIYLDTVKVLNKQRMKSIKKFIFGGEGYPKSKLKSLFDIYGDRSEFINVYGPTECTCICSSHTVTAETFEDLNGFPPLGKIADNFSYLILDDSHQEVPDGDIGELCLLGPNVGKGYYNDPVRTQENFIQNPLHNKYVDIIYKTGDLVRFNGQDGNLYFIGRKDNQIKHMGYRIELEEIELALSSLSYVSQAAVIHSGSRGISQLIAFVSFRNSVEERRIRADLKDKLPGYMIPNRFIIQNDELPKNANGKVDKRRLSETHFQAVACSKA